MDTTEESDNISELSSDFFDDSTTEGAELGVRPYMFEPERDPNEELPAPSPIESQLEDRIGNNDWCTCKHCPAMSTAQESICCTEIPQVMNNLEQEKGKCCITEHRDFSPVCLHPAVLRTAYYAYRQQYEELPECNGYLKC